MIMATENVTPIMAKRAPRRRTSDYSANPLIESDPRDTLAKASAALKFLARAELLDDYPSDELKFGRQLCLDCCYEAFNSLAPALEPAKVAS
jgi:hypothetical protein